MTVTRLGGIDPGIVHTGVVVLRIDDTAYQVDISHQVIVGHDPEVVSDAVAGTDYVWIEKYRPRSHFQHDATMAKAVSEIHKAIPKSKVLDNTGIKSIVTDRLLDLLQMRRWATPSHHDDVLSAARILLLGMMKNPEYNKMLADIVSSRLDSENIWSIRKL